jgi:hypothetical protein
MPSAAARYNAVASADVLGVSPQKRRQKKPKGLLFCLFGTSIGQMFLLVIGGSLIVLGGAVALGTTRPDYATSDPPGEHDEEEPQTGF